MRACPPMSKREHIVSELKCSSSRNGSQTIYVIMSGERRFSSRKVSSASVTRCRLSTVTPTQALAGHSTSSNREGYIGQEKILPGQAPRGGGTHDIHDLLDPLFRHPGSEKLSVPADQYPDMRRVLLVGNTGAQRRLKLPGVKTRRKGIGQLACLLVKGHGVVDILGGSACGLVSCAAVWAFAPATRHGIPLPARPANHVVAGSLSSRAVHQADSPALSR